MVAYIKMAHFLYVYVHICPYMYIYVHIHIGNGPILCMRPYMPYMTYMYLYLHTCNEKYMIPIPPIGYMYTLIKNNRNPNVEI